MRKSDLSGKNLLTFEQLEVGMKLPAIVQAIKPFGIFVGIQSSRCLTGLCHRSEIIDEEEGVDGDKKGGGDDAAWRDMYEPGDYVLVKVLKIDSETRKFSVGMKRSYFDDDDYREEELSGDDEDDDEDDANAESDDMEVESIDSISDDAGDIDSESDYSDEDDDEDDDDDDDEQELPAEYLLQSESDSDEENLLEVYPAEMEVDDSDESDESDGEDGNSDVDRSQSSDEAESDSADEARKTKGNVKGISGGFQFEEFKLPGELEVNSEESDSDDDGVPSAKVAATSAKKKNLSEEEKAQLERLRLRQIEESQTEKPPENVDDFEKMLMGSPNSSFIWIQYMAFMMSLAEIDKAREVHRINNKCFCRT